MRREDRTWARGYFKSFHPSAGPGEFERWLSYVSEVDVNMHAGGRAVLTHPETPNVHVVVRWDADGITSILVETQPGEPLPRVEVSMSPFMAALELRRRSIDGPRSTTVTPGTVAARVAIPVPSVRTTSRPQKGKPAPLDWYREVIAQYDQLVSAHHHGPTRELSKRYWVSPGTVKSWLARGRKYLKGEA